MIKEENIDVDVNLCYNYFINYGRQLMDKEKTLQWLIGDKHMSVRSAKDVLSRCGRVCRMLQISEIDDNTLENLLECDEFKNSSMFIKSQLKRTVALCLEFASQAEMR